MIRRAVSLPHALFALLLAATAVYAVTGDGAIRNVIQVGAVTAMAIHTLRRRDARLAWWLLIAAQATWAIGDFAPFELTRSMSSPTASPTQGWSASSWRRRETAGAPRSPSTA